MASPKSTMLYASSLYLTPADIRRIIQASVFVADQVLLPTTVQPSHDLTEAESHFVLTRINELRELGALNFWEIEGQPDLLPRMRSRDKLSVHPDKVIPYEDYKTISELIDDRLMQQRNIFLGADAISHDGITEMVLGKQTMWKFAVAKSLNADRLLLDQKTKAAMRQFFTDLMRYQEFESLIIDRIADKLDLPDISQLSVEDIERCRKLMPAFRAKLMIATQNQFNEIFLQSLIEDIANGIVNDFFDLINSHAHDPKIVEVFGKPMLRPTVFAKEATWDIVQVLFAPVIAAKYAWLFFKWFTDSSETVPLLLLMQLRQLK